jgi:DNA-binding CsgD family transcriptional regulator
MEATMLTSRERQVLQGLADGMTVKEICLALGISRRWCAELVARSRRKMGASTSNEALALAVALGVVTPAGVVLTRRPVEVYG